MKGEAFVIIITVIASHSLVFGMFYLYFRNRHRERMSMIEKGVDPSIFIQKPSNSTSNALKYGLFLGGLAVGLFMGTILDYYTELEDPAVYFSMIFLFGGIGLLSYYVIERRNAKRGDF